MIKMLLKIGLLLALCSLFVTTALAKTTSENIAADVKALMQLADEYADTGKAPELSLAIKKLGILRGQWEAAGSPEPYAQDVTLEAAKWRDLIEGALEPSLDSESEFDTIAKIGYAGEYNGTTLKKGEVVITFDDGPHPTLTPLVHAIVKQLNIPAAFFELEKSKSPSRSHSRLSLRGLCYWRSQLGSPAINIFK